MGLFLCGFRNYFLVFNYNYLVDDGYIKIDNLSIKKSRNKSITYEKSQFVYTVTVKGSIKYASDKLDTDYVYYGTHYVDISLYDSKGRGHGTITINLGSYKDSISDSNGNYIITKEIDSVYGDFDKIAYIKSYYDDYY